MSVPVSSAARTSVVRAAIVGLAIIGAAVVLAGAFRAFVDARYVHSTIRVTGSATRPVHSDLAIWHASVSVSSESLPGAYRELATATEAVREYLRAQGATDAEMRIAAIVTDVRTETQYTRDGEGNVLTETSRIVGYSLSRAVVVTSGDLGRVERIANGFTDLLERGIDVRSNPVEYIFTGLAGLKIQLIEAATRDARERAERVARASGARIGEIESAEVGVVQVNAQHQTETQWDGVYDRSAVEKDAMVTVRTVFSLR